MKCSRCGRNFEGNGVLENLKWKVLQEEDVPEYLIGKNKLCLNCIADYDIRDKTILIKTKDLECKNPMCENIIFWVDMPRENPNKIKCLKCGQVFTP